MIANVHRLETPNCGDIASGPLQYCQVSGQRRFIELNRCQGKHKSVEADLARADLLVLGGGGLLDHPKFAPVIQRLIDRYGHKLIVWGAGTNALGSHRKAGIPPTDLSGVALVGRRDYPPTENSLWVPCASCLHPALRPLIKVHGSRPRRGIAILENNAGAKTHAIDDCGYQSVRRLGNKNVSFEQVIEFILSAELLVTSSFHGVYWATLCGVPVIGIPTSAKFSTLRHTAPLASAKNWPDFIQQARVYPRALQECTDANLTFMRRVRKDFPGTDIYWSEDRVGAWRLRRPLEHAARRVERVIRTLMGKRWYRRPTSARSNSSTST